MGQDVRPDTRKDVRGISRPKTFCLGCFSVPDYLGVFCLFQGFCRFSSTEKSLVILRVFLVKSLENQGMEGQGFRWDVSRAPGSFVGTLPLRTDPLVRVTQGTSHFVAIFVDIFPESPKLANQWVQAFLAIFSWRRLEFSKNASLMCTSSTHR